MSVGIKHAERVRLTGQRIKMGFLDAEQRPYTYDVEIDDYLGEGGSCICYETTVHKNSADLGQRRVLKQFYPDPRSYELDTEMDGMRLTIQGYSEEKDKSRNPEVNRLGEFFEQAFARQVELSNKEELTDVVVRPDLCHFDGLTKYALYEADCGQCLDLEKIGTVEELVEKMYGLARALQKVHGQGILYMDLKPSNILVSGGGQIKLFDFDAAIDMNNLKNVHLKNHDVRYDMSDLNLIAPEIRPDRLGEFEQNKEIFLKERVDVYSFGAILFFYFMGRYPALEECASFSCREELKQVFAGRFRGELTEEESELLLHLLEKCIRKDIGPGGRYESMDPVADDLQKLKGMLGAPLSKRRRVYKRVGGRLQAAYVMDKHPLSKYRRKDGNGQWVMDALLMGDDPLIDDFLANILSCAQMLDTKTVIRVLRPEAGKALARYRRDWPLLKRTTRLFLNDKPFVEARTKEPFPLDKAIAETPFAEIRFYDWNPGQDEVKRVTHMERIQEISWIVAAQAEISSNLPLAERLAEQLAGREAQTFIAYLDERGDGFDLRKPNQSYENVVMFPFGCNDKQSLEEKEFESGIKKQALLLHKYYMREWDERADALSVWRDFSSEAYNVNSSLCSVLSIPYKLASVGIRTTGGEAASEFWQQVLNDSGPVGRRKFNDLIYLEHRRWMCFMLTEGYDRPDRKTLSQYAFRGKNDQRSKADKLHPCICASSREAGLMLEDFPHEKWERYNLYDPSKNGDISLDGLDTMSVSLHQLCRNRISQMTSDGEFRDAFRKLKKAMKEEHFPEEAFELFDTLEVVCGKMLDNESNINRLWKKTCGAFGEALTAWKEASPVHIESAASAFGELKNKMRIVEERNLYHDYKSSDRTILEALPILLTCDDPIRRIHKPVAEKTWQNVASSIIMEPEQLYLYTDEPELLEEDLIKSFLREERGIPVDTIVVKDMNALRNLQVTKTSVKSVLDITGLSAEQTYELANLENLKSLPVIAFRDGKVRSMSGESEADYYGALRRHLTVNETFRLCHGHIRTEKSQNHMLGLASNYIPLWRSYLTIGAFKYHVLVEALHEIERGHYWQLSHDTKAEELLTFEKRRVHMSMLKEAGVDALLDALCKDRWVERNYKLPEPGQMGNVQIRTAYPRVREMLARIFALMERHPYLHKFEYICTDYEPCDGPPSAEKLYYIYDNTLVVDEAVSERTADKKNQQSRRGILEEALSILSSFKSWQGEAQILEPLSEDTDGFTETIPGDESQFALRFLYRNRSTRECLMKEGNILEAYVYHSIWKNAAVDDVKLNVVFSWDNGKEAEASEGRPIVNEIDLVCTRNMRTYFISCKQTPVQTEHLQEIKYFADYFGIDGKAVLVGGRPLRTYDSRGYVEDRSRKMHVCLIDGGMMSGGAPALRSERLARYIQNIIDGKSDWKDIED